MLPRNSAATRNCSCSIQTVDVSIKEGESKGKEEILLLFLRRARGKLGRASRKTHGKAFWPSALHFRKQALVAPSAPKFNIKQLNLKHKDSMSGFWVFQPLRFRTTSTNFIFSAKIQIKDGLSFCENLKTSFWVFFWRENNFSFSAPKFLNYSFLDFKRIF